MDDAVQALHPGLVGERWAAQARHSGMVRGRLAGSSGEDRRCLRDIAGDLGFEGVEGGEALFVAEAVEEPEAQERLSRQWRCGGRSHRIERDPCQRQWFRMCTSFMIRCALPG